jgi:hypothetical protein
VQQGYAVICSCSSPPRQKLFGGSNTDGERRADAISLCAEDGFKPTGLSLHHGFSDKMSSSVLGFTIDMVSAQAERDHNASALLVFGSGVLASFWEESPAVLGAA